MLIYVYFFSKYIVIMVDKNRSTRRRVKSVYTMKSKNLFHKYAQLGGGLEEEIEQKKKELKDYFEYSLTILLVINLFYVIKLKAHWRNYQFPKILVILA